MRRLACLALFAPAVVLAAPAMQPGLWEITTSAEMSNMPMKIPPQTMRRCLTAEDMADNRKTIPADKNCKLEDVRQHGDTTTWKASCKMDKGEVKGEMKGGGQMTAKADSFEGSMVMSANIQGMNFDIKNTYTAKRVGDCK